MVELTQKNGGGQDDKPSPLPGITASAVIKKPEDKAPPPLVESFSLPLEFSSSQDGIQIIVQGDFVEVRFSQYLAEYIGMFRSCTRVVAKFKQGGVPDITAIHEQG